ncbi:MAG TPA: adenosylhomocysteinase [Methanolinea sp.]|jgi:adenosylhomocysteinase|nr:adenosylhomocysteinase [Methanolinea sp.]HOS81911.1 adenosylhomocysteinase [Methanolinea sp.]HPC54657.1 adenosylhomocysteinase [Methanolinea sp.]HQE85622.1 adenosylhomocysteinase [Methanolinea sp.]HQI14445.1 adenosylhomocysteinase [Methanolinea sp.]
METGKKKIAWARQYMPVLASIRGEFQQNKPLKGIRIGMALHVEAKTACLVETLAAGGADVHITGCNPLSTQDDVARALDEVPGVHCYARRGVTAGEYYAAIDRVLDSHPQVVIDDGMDLIHRLHTVRRDLLPHVVGGCEETTTGVHRLRAMAREGKLAFPVIAVNDTPMKRHFDNVHGTGESAIAGIMLTTNMLVAGKVVVVAGYGFCGRGLARKLHGLGARVIVTEVDPRRALEAYMDGFSVMPMEEAAGAGEIFITATGNTSVIAEPHFARMKSGVVLANAGHFNVEIDIGWLEKNATAVTRRDGIDTYTVDGKDIHVLAEGRLVNLAVPKGMGHPIEVMDLSFSLQALCALHIARQGRTMNPGVHEVPPEIDETVAERKLASLGLSIDKLTELQKSYLSGWESGT